MYLSLRDEEWEEGVRKSEGVEEVRIEDVGPC